MIKSFKINEDKIGLLSIFKPLLLATIDSLAQFSDYMLKCFKRKNYIRINDYGDNLKLNLIPESLLVKASESFKIKYKDKLKIFLKMIKKSYFKNLLLRISKLHTN